MEDVSLEAGQIEGSTSGFLLPDAYPKKQSSRGVFNYPKVVFPPKS